MEEKAAKCKAKAEFWKLSRVSESMWRQKSRLNWMKFGDKNTRYFQTIANNRFRRNLVGSIEVNGRLLEDPGEIKLAAAEYFENNFKEKGRVRPRLVGIFHRSLGLEISAEIEKPFEEREIWSAMKECSNDKAPGPDGFNFSFVKKGWKSMKSLILQFFAEFHINGKLTKGINSSFVTLIVP